MCLDLNSHFVAMRKPSVWLRSQLQVTTEWLQAPGVCLQGDCHKGKRRCCQGGRPLRLVVQGLVRLQLLCRFTASPRLCSHIPNLQNYNHVAPSDSVSNTFVIQAGVVRNLPSLWTVKSIVSSSSFTCASFFSSQLSFAMSFLTKLYLQMASGCNIIL